MRLAFSNGLNVESLHCSLGFDIQEARRTWWLVYIQEVELSLDSGRPMTLRSAEMNVKYPNVEVCSRCLGFWDPAPLADTVKASIRWRSCYQICSDYVYTILSGYS
jgi:hypothetical protein